MKSGLDKFWKINYPIIIFGLTLLMISSMILGLENGKGLYLIPFFFSRLLFTIGAIIILLFLTIIFIIPGSIQRPNPNYEFNPFLIKNRKIDKKNHEKTFIFAISFYFAICNIIIGTIISLWLSNVIIFSIFGLISIILAIIAVISLIIISS